MHLACMSSVILNSVSNKLKHPSILQLDAQHKHHPKELSIGRAILGTFVHVQTWNLSRNSSWWFQPL